jgi:hypothetical protein
MSKRFGRNQRRQAREAIAQAERAAELARDAAKGAERRERVTARENRRLLAVIEGVRDALGEHTMALPMVAYYFGDDIAKTPHLPSALSMWRREPVPPIELKMPDEALELRTIRDDVLDVLEAYVDGDHKARNPHVFIKRQGRRDVAFALPREYLFAAPIDELKRYMVRPIADALVKVIEAERDAAMGDRWRRRL